MYDIIIIGAGPAGLTSAIYAKEANKSVLVLEKMGEGGQLNNIFNVTNYPGFWGIDGFELAQNMKNQAVKLGAEFKTEEVLNVNFSSNIKKVMTKNNTYESKYVIIATGAKARHLGLDSEEYFYGKGLSYCATCDGNFFKGKTVAVVGGGNSSIDDCLYLSNVAKKIYLIHRRDTFTATQGALEKVYALGEGDGKIEILKNSEVVGLIGENKLSEIEILNNKTNATSKISVDGLFVAIGRVPETEIFKDKLKLSDGGFIETNKYMETSEKGVYAVGDVRNTVLRQIITACSDGALAISCIIKNNI